jgi:hypothetical protein
MSDSFFGEGKMYNSFFFMGKMYDSFLERGKMYGGFLLAAGWRSRLIPNRGPVPDEISGNLVRKI